MPSDRFTSTERRGLLVLTALLVAGICAVAIIRSCDDHGHSVNNRECGSDSIAADTIVMTGNDTDTSADPTRQPRKTKRKPTRQTPDGRERSHRDESVVTYSGDDHNSQRE